MHEMQRATTTAGRTIAVLSPAYLSSQFGEAEWRVAFANDPSGEKRLLIPVRVAEVDPPGLLATKIYIDLVGKDRDHARRALLDGLQDQPAVVPTTEPAFPGGQTAAVEVFGPIGRSRGSLAPCRRCGTCRTCATGRSPGGRRYWQGWRTTWALGRPPRSRRPSPDWVGWARPAWRSSTPTGSTPSLRWCGGSGPRSPRPC